jgi:hypothetical protein
VSLNWRLTLRFRLKLRLSTRALCCFEQKRRLDFGTSKNKKELVANQTIFGIRQSSTANSRSQQLQRTKSWPDPNPAIDDGSESIGSVVSVAHRPHSDCSSLTLNRLVISLGESVHISRLCLVSLWRTCCSTRPVAPVGPQIPPTDPHHRSISVTWPVLVDAGSSSSAARAECDDEFASMSQRQTRDSIDVITTRHGSTSLRAVDLSTLNLVRTSATVHNRSGL